jgi:hypothetical protein
MVVPGSAELLGVRRHHPHLLDAFGVRVRLGAVGGRDVVIDDGERLLRRAHLAFRRAQAFECLR